MDELLGAYGSDSEGSGAEGRPAGPESPEGGEDFFAAPAAAPPPLPVPQPPPGPGRTGAGAAVPADLLQAMLVVHWVQRLLFGILKTAMKEL